MNNPINLINEGNKILNKSCINIFLVIIYYLLHTYLINFYKIDIRNKITISSDVYIYILIIIGLIINLSQLLI